LRLALAGALVSACRSHRHDPRRRPLLAKILAAWKPHEGRWNS
jgi:hypothetical protein